MKRENVLTRPTDRPTVEVAAVERAATGGGRRRRTVRKRCVPRPAPRGEPYTRFYMCGQRPPYSPPALPPLVVHVGAARPPARCSDPVRAWLVPSHARGRSRVSECVCPCGGGGGYLAASEEAPQVGGSARRRRRRWRWRRRRRLLTTHRRLEQKRRRRRRMRHLAQSVGRAC